MIHFWDLFRKKQVNNSEENTQQNVPEVISPDQITSENIFEKLGARNNKRKFLYKFPNNSCQSR